MLHIASVFLKVRNMSAATRLFSEGLDYSTDLDLLSFKVSCSKKVFTEAK